MIPEFKQITINGNPIKSYQYLQLKQQINDHHYFEIGIDIENIELEGTHTIDKSKDWLGKNVEIKTHEKEFSGIVTNVRMIHDKGHHGQIIVSGNSSTIVLENGIHTKSWLKKSLQTIVEEVTKHPKLTTRIKPEYTSEITYETQYRETNFQFLKRIAKQYHEWLYYDGETLFFGKPKKTKAIELIYGVDVSELQVGIQTQARKYESFSYNSLVDEQYVSKSPDAPAGLNELGQLAFNASLDNYTDPTNTYSHKRIGNKAELDEYLKKKQQSDYAASNFISLKTNRRGLTLGDIIDLRSEIFIEKGSFLNKRHGEYIITEIEHYATVGNHYSNTIIALPADINTLPEPMIDFPIAETQMATVIDNEDPENKGRVQVKMAWQTAEMKTSWIRVMTPDGGISDNVSTNRGFVFIPEKGDQVLIGFRYNDPNRPFVMGSLFNGKTGVGGSDKNRIKSITTRSGSTITFDDNEKKGKITVSDPSGNTITLNGDETITISAPKTLTLSAKNIFLNGSENIELNGDNIKASGGTNIVADAPTVGITGKKTLTLKGTNSAELNGGKKTNITGNEIISSSTANTTISGMIVKINS